jgi:hypothetical protein
MWECSLESANNKSKGPELWATDEFAEHKTGHCDCSTADEEEMRSEKKAGARVRKEPMQAT